MATYSLGVSWSADLNSGTVVVWEFRTSALANARITELSLISTALGATTGIGMGRPATRGVGPIGALAPVAEDSAFPASLSQIATAWQNAPGAPTNYMRRYSVNAGLPTPGIILTSPKGILVPAAASFVVQLTSSTGVGSGICSTNVVAVE